VQVDDGAALGRPVHLGRQRRAVFPNRGDRHFQVFAVQRKADIVD